jgi:hypothetical protein
MQKNKAKISSAKQTPIKEAKNKKLLVIYYIFVLFKLAKLQIANIKVKSLAQALDIIKNFPNCRSTRNARHGTFIYVICLLRW